MTYGYSIKVKEHSPIHGVSFLWHLLSLFTREANTSVRIKGFVHTRIYEIVMELNCYPNYLLHNKPHQKLVALNNMTCFSWLSVGWLVIIWSGLPERSQLSLAGTFADGWFQLEHTRLLASSHNPHPRLSHVSVGTPRGSQRGQNNVTSITCFHHQLLSQAAFGPQLDT